MKLALADIPRPFLAEPRIVASVADGAWQDFADMLDASGIADAPAAGDLPQTLSFLSHLPSASRARLDRVLAAHGKGAAPLSALRSPVGPDAKMLLTEGSLALSRSNDQRPAKMVVGFSKFATAFADPDSAIRLPDPAARYDVEAVLAAVIGRPGNRLAGDAAARSVVGFTLMAEITWRDMFETEARTNNSLFAKNCPGLSPLGPSIWIAGTKELDPATEVTLTINGTMRQRFTVADFAHGITASVKAWSRTVLAPGDMVALGAAICRPRPGNDVDSPIPIAPGDRIEIACAPIGVLRATIAR